jgi:tetratricopeptide (TPR) repeat protein
VSPGGPSSTKTTGADPKDKIEEYKAISGLMTEGLVALREGRPAQTLERFQGLERRGVDGYELHFYRGRAYAALKRWREAAVEYERAAAKLPGDVAAWRGVGESRVELRDWPAAAHAFEKVVSLAPGDAFARMQLGEAYRDAGDITGATREMREAVRLDPAPASYWNALGTMIGSGGEMAQAEQAFANAVSRDPGNGLFLFNDAVALERLGRRDEAVTQYRRSASLGYSLAATRLTELDRAPKRPAR